METRFMFATNNSQQVMNTEYAFSQYAKFRKGEMGLIIQRILWWLWKY